MTDAAVLDPTTSGGMTTDLDKSSGSSIAQLDSLIGKTQQAGQAAAAKMESYNNDISKIINGMPDPNSIAKPTKPQTSPFVAPQQEDPVEQFGSFASTLGLIASAFTRTPLTTALRSSAGAINAARAGNTEAYNRSFNEWKANTDLAYKQADWENSNYKSALDLMSTDYQRGLAQIRTIAAQADDQPVLQMLKAGDPAKIASLIEERQRLVTNGVSAADKSYTLGRKRQLDNDLQAARASGDSEAVSKAQQAIMDFQSIENPYAGTGTAAKMRDTAQLEQSAVNEFKATNGRDPTFDELIGIRQKIAAAQKGTAGTNATLAPEDANRIARQYIAGDKSGIQGLGYGNAGAANRAAVQSEITRVMKESGKTPEAITAKISEFSGLTAAQRTLGVQTSRLGLAVAELEEFVPLAVELSNKIDRTKYPTINSMIEAVRKGTGDENIVRFIDANNALENAYSQVVTRGGVPTDTARKTAREVLATNFSKGQYAAGSDQLLQEGYAARRAPGTVRQELTNAVTGVPETDAKQIETRAKVAWGSYEPEKYDYRINPTTRAVERKAK